MAAEPLNPLPPPQRLRIAWAPLALAMAAAAALAAVAVWRPASPLGVEVTIAGLLIVGGAVSLWFRGQGTARLAAPAPTAESPVLAPVAPFAAILETLEDPMMVVAGDEPDDLAGRRVIYANAAARELFPTTRETAALVTAVRDPRVLEVVDEALFGRIASETTYEAGGAQDRVWRAKARPLGEQGGRSMALLVMRDETETRRSERTRADFLANASHELRTPLASLSGFIETLRGHAREDPEARDRFLGIMHDQARRMARLIEDLMSLSRIELNEHVPPQGRADLGLMVKDALDALGPLAAEKCVRFDARLPDAPAMVQPADRDQVLQVIQNLAENALKYAPKGSTVTLEVTPCVSAEAALAQRAPGAAHLSLLTPDHAADQRYVLLRVIDAGPGMAREHLPRLTERFYRVAGQKGGEKTGTGLGLAIVKHIMNRHRGGLTVESAEGEGAAFSAYFPTGS
jgi:two-component system phosphate regulon sensor histidine kinase PhoR